MNITANENLDPMPIGTLVMWFFLASEAMFFIGLLGAFIVLKSAGGQHELFVQSSQAMGDGIGLASVASLFISSMTLRRMPTLAIISGSLFMILQSLQWRILLRHNHGPTQNNYFSFYFLLSTVHALHLIVGIAAIIWLRCKLSSAVQIYWHFVNGVGVITLAAIYFI